MDLNIKDVAELIQVSETTIREWLSEGNIPGYCINGQYRFSRQEIETWVMANQKEVDETQSPKGNLRFSLYRAVNHGGVFFDVEGESKEEVICNAAELLADKLNLDAQVLSELLLDREKLMPTSLNHGLAMPHARDFLLDGHQDVVAVVFPKKPIEYGALDGQPVHTLFFLFAADDRHHLNLLAKIAHLSSQSDARETLQQRPSGKELLGFIKTWEGQVPLATSSSSDN